MTINFKTKLNLVIVKVILYNDMIFLGRKKIQPGKNANNVYFFRLQSNKASGHTTSSCSTSACMRIPWTRSSNLPATRRKSGWHWPATHR